MTPSFQPSLSQKNWGWGTVRGVEPWPPIRGTEHKTGAMKQTYRIPAGPRWEDHRRNPQPARRWIDLAPREDLARALQANVQIRQLERFTEDEPVPFAIAEEGGQ